jgi:hypothetical protein
MVNLFNKSPNFDLIEFGKAVKGGDGKYFISSSLKDNQSISCQFGPDLKSKETLNESSTSIEVKILNEQTTDFIKECEDHYIKYAKQNKDTWFPNQNITDNYLDQAFMPSIKVVKKENHFKTKLSKKIVIFNSSKEEVEMKNVFEGSQISVIVNIAGLWFTKTRFGVTWIVQQIKINNVQSKKQMQCLFNDEEEDLSEVFPDE